MPPRLAIFYVDGTLADSIPVLFEVMNEAAGRFGFRRMTRDDFQRLRALPGRQAARELEVAMWQAPALTAFVRRRAAEERARVRLFDGVPAMLESLQARGVALAIVTTNAEPTVRAVLGDRPGGLVSHDGGGASVFGKRRKLRAALGAAGVAPGDALSVGDELRDLDASRAEGMTPTPPASRARAHPVRSSPVTSIGSDPMHDDGTQHPHPHPEPGESRERERDRGIRRADHTTPGEQDEPNPPRTTKDGITAPKFGSAGSGGAELEPGPKKN